MAETERLAYFTVVHALDLNSFHNSSSSSSNSRNLQTEQCLQSCVVKMLERHSMVFSGMMQRLHIDRSVKFREGFCEIAEELFKDEVTWSKIVALFAFGARLAQHCREHHMEDLVEDVAVSLATFAHERITPFLQSEGGWVSASIELDLSSSAVLTAGPAKRGVPGGGGLREQGLAGAGGGGPRSDSGHSYHVHQEMRSQDNN